MALVTRIHGLRNLTGHIYSLGAKGFVITVKSPKRLFAVGEETAQAKVDLTALYDGLEALPATVTDHAATHGSETLGPGVYTQVGAMNITGTLTLNGSATDLFVFRCAGAFTTGASAEVILTGGAVSSNVFFLSHGASSTGANTVFRGNLLAIFGDLSTGAGTTLEGRALAIGGAIALGDSTTVTAPTGTSVQALGTLDSFSLFTSAGAISTTGTGTTVELGIGTHNGAITGFEIYVDSSLNADLREEDDAVDEAVEIIVKEINPLMFTVKDDNSGEIHVIMDINHSVEGLKSRIRNLGTTVGPNNVDASGTEVSEATDLTIAP